MFSLKNKTSIITGGGSGIGKAIALLFAKQGSEVHVLDLDENSLAVVEEINALGQRSSFHKCDVAKQDEVRATVESIVSPSKPVDILVNNAGIARSEERRVGKECRYER